MFHPPMNHLYMEEDVLSPGAQGCQVSVRLPCRESTSGIGIGQIKY
jgi:hypothetical protein